MTEYLAAAELAKRYLLDPQTLKEKLTLTRWDQALFLTLSLLPPVHADLFLRDVIRADFVLALNASKYLETGRDEVIKTLLSEVPKHARGKSKFDWKLQSAIEFGLPVTEVHESELRAIIGCGGLLGGATVVRLVELRGDEIKVEVLQLLLDKRSDYNFCTNGVGRALKPFASPQDASSIAAWADMVQSKTSPDSAEDSTAGFTSGASEFLSSLDLAVIRRELLPSGEETSIPEIRAEIFYYIIRHHHSTDAMNFAAELLLRGVKKACTAICFIAKHGKYANQLSWTSFTLQHAQCLQEIVKTTYRYWGLDALRYLCGARKDLVAWVEQIASHKVGIAKAALLYCVSPTNLAPVFDAMMGLTTLSEEERNREPLDLLKRIDLDSSGNADLFVELLRTRDANVALALLGDSLPNPLNLTT